MFKDDSTKGRYGVESAKRYIETLNSKIDCDYCVLQYTEHWKTNKNERMNQMKLIYDARQAAQKEQRDRQARNQRKADELDDLFRK